MKVLLLFAHPVETSFGAALHRTALNALIEAGHEVDDCDLYAEDFQPVMSRQERLDYHNTAKNTAYVKPYVARVLAAEALIFCYPIWNYGPPAIMKGFFDRVFLPGVCFDIRPDGKIVGRLHQLKKMACIFTYGGSRWRTVLAGDPPRKIMRRATPIFSNFKAPVTFLVQHDMNTMTKQKGQRFIAKVHRVMSGF